MQIEYFVTPSPLVGEGKDGGTSNILTPTFVLPH